MELMLFVPLGRSTGESFADDLLRVPFFEASPGLLL